MKNSGLKKWIKKKQEELDEELDRQTALNNLIQKGHLVLIKDRKKQIEKNKNLDNEYNEILTTLPQILIHCPSSIKNVKRKKFKETKRKRKRFKNIF
jgi:hypothetical protein